jgi:hypothetical protein
MHARLRRIYDGFKTFLLALLCCYVMLATGDAGTITKPSGLGPKRSRVTCDDSWRASI